MITDDGRHLTNGKFDDIVIGPSALPQHIEQNGPIHFEIKEIVILEERYSGNL